MRNWETQSPLMKKVWISLAFVTAFVLVHGTLTFRTNHQKAFAITVEAKIDIKTIHVKAVHGILVLSGQGTKEQSHYAEELARFYIKNYSVRAINPPVDLRNEIVLNPRTSSVTKGRGPAHRAAPKRSVASRK